VEKELRSKMFSTLSSCCQALLRESYNSAGLPERSVADLLKKKDWVRAGAPSVSGCQAGSKIIDQKAKYFRCLNQRKKSKNNLSMGRR